MNSDIDIIVQNSSVSLNTTYPYSYNEWLLQNARVISEDSTEEYNQYIYNWYKVNSSNNTTNSIKNDYKTLLKELTLFFTKEEQDLFLTDINFDDDIDIIYAIPFFVKKLKAVALTIAAKREDIKNTKFKYNLIGSTAGLESILYQNLLKAFTSSDKFAQLSSNTLGMSFPALSAVKDDILIEVEELYDPSTYSSNINSSTHVSVPHVYENPLYTLFKAFLDQFSQNTLPLSAFNDYTVNSTPKIYNEIKINTKYLSNSLYTLSSSNELTLAITADVPYLNLTNTHYSVIATQPDTSNLTSKTYTGGFLLPSKLGVPYYLGRGFTNTLNPLKINDINNLLFLDPDIYTSNRGLTEEDQPSPYETTHIDNTWVRDSALAGKKSGVIINAANYQQFVPYQSSYETYKANIFGVSRQDDNFDFWSSADGEVWNDETNYPSNYRKENTKIAERASKLLVTNKITANWTTDIYGNNYSLLKNYSSKISTMREAEGEVWVRDVFNNVDTGSVVLKELYDSHKGAIEHYQNLLQNKIISFETIEDVIFIRTKSGVSINKFIYDLQDRSFYNNSSLQFFVECKQDVLSPNRGDIYCGYWYNESEKNIYVNIIRMHSTSKTMFNFIIYKYDITSGILSTLLQDYIESAVFIPQVFNVKLPATFKYNTDTNTFNTTFIFNKFDIYSIDVKNYSDNPYISSVTLIN